MVVLLVSIDDIIIARPDLKNVNSVRSLLQTLFNLKVLDNLKYFLGLEIVKFSDGIS